MSSGRMHQLETSKWVSNILKYWIKYTGFQYSSRYFFLVVDGILAAHMDGAYMSRWDSRGKAWSLGGYQQVVASWIHEISFVRFA
jgi:hypothetical protein